jgi:23S rRNA (guanosine2251-2'-O)-methyltransferase
MVIGMHPAMEAINSGKEIESIFLQIGLKGEGYQELHQLAKDRNIRVKRVPIEKLNRLSRKNHQGVILFVSPIPFVQLGNLLPQIYEKGQDPFFVLLDSITDVRNFGAIVRTAEAMGANGIVIGLDNSAPVNEDALKTAAGAFEYLPICREHSLTASVDFLRNSGLTIVGVTEKAANSIYTTKFDGPIAIIMGAEDVGISDQLIKECDELVKIPLNGNVASLNVSVAAGIAISEIVRQRNA